MELRYLATVKAILETGSFQNAARKLNYTQSTITFQIQQLEQELSTKLFEKIGRRMVLTQAGSEILPYIDTIIQSAEQITNYGKSLLEMTGSLNIALPETLLTYKIQPALKAFRQQAPNVSLALQMLNCYEISGCLVSGKADIGIHYDVGSYPDSVVVEPLAAFPMALVAAPCLGKAEGDFTQENQRKSICLINNDPGSLYQEIFDKYLKDKNIQLNSIMEIWSMDAQKKSVASNLGVAYLPRFAVEGELQAGSLIELATGLGDRRVPVVMCYHKNKWISPAMELFIRLVKESMT